MKSEPRTPRTLRRKALVAVTCDSMHNHGSCVIEFGYSELRPSIFTLTVDVVSVAYPQGRRHVAEFARDWVARLVSDGKPGETLILGPVSLKIRLSAPDQLSLRLQLPDGVSDDDRTFMLVSNRDFVERYIADTYAVVPESAERQIIAAEVDRFLADVLGGAR